VLIESTKGPVWGWGTSSEHSVLYNYQIANSSAVYLALIQTETPYFQGNPTATTPFTVNKAFYDPDFAATCGAAGGPACDRAWGLRIIDSTDVFLYGGGLYSFFDNYDQTCLKTQSCQDNMVSVEGSGSKVHLFGLSTKASTNMLTFNGRSLALDKDNRNNFCATLAFFSSA
jgi:glucan 1,3-beta-glucosidase